MEEATKSKGPEAIGSILEAFLRNPRAAAEANGGGPARRQASDGPGIPAAPKEDGGARYDFDLAEFPLFRFHKARPQRRSAEPLTYTDTIVGADGRRVSRGWEVYPGPFGFGGSSTQALLYDLFQLYVEQGGTGSQIQFGTLRSLLLRRGQRNPSRRDYERLRRDFDILRGYDFHCQNAFWDRRRRAYVDMNWRLFGAVFYFKGKPTGVEDDVPFGFIEVSPVLRQVARERGFFPLGFSSDLFHRLKPLEQRLAVYLAKKFLSQALHRRFTDDLARALPIEAARPRDVRATLKAAGHGLLEKRLPILRSFHLDQARDGRPLAVFHRSPLPRRSLPKVCEAPGEPSVEVRYLVERIVAETGCSADRLWWTQCARRLGQGPVDRALGQLREVGRATCVRNPGGLLTKIFKDLAVEAGIALR